MKKTFIAITILSFAAISVFGLFAMSYMRGNCLAETVNGGVCPLGSPLAGIAFHLDAFRVFSNAVVGTVLSILSVLVSFALFSSFVLKPAEESIGNRSVYSNYAPVSQSQNKRSVWIARHEKRDPYLSN